MYSSLRSHKFQGLKWAGSPGSVDPGAPFFEIATRVLKWATRLPTRATRLLNRATRLLNNGVTRLLIWCDPALNIVRPGYSKNVRFAPPPPVVSSTEAVKQRPGSSCKQLWPLPPSSNEMELSMPQLQFFCKILQIRHCFAKVYFSLAYLCCM